MPDLHRDGSGSVICTHPRGYSHPRAYGFEVVMWCPDCRCAYEKPRPTEADS